MIFQGPFQILTFCDPVIKLFFNKLQNFPYLNKLLCLESIFATEEELNL